MNSKYLTNRRFNPKHNNPKNLPNKERRLLGITITGLQKKSFLKTKPNLRI